jgi:hypothetical protein
MRNNKFIEKFRNKTKNELLEILNNSTNYTSEAIEAVEFLLQDISTEKSSEIKQLKTVEKELIEEANIINETKELKFYSQKAIGIATFIGSPLAAGYLIRENFITLNNHDKGTKALLIGIISTILLFTGIFMIPESIIEAFPNQLLPAIYTGIIYLIVENIHGTILNKHKENGNVFYSNWKAGFIGLISLLIIGLTALGIIYFETNEFSMIEYQEKMEEFDKNEMETKAFYSELSYQTEQYLLRELDFKIIPNWKKNILIVKESNQIEGLDKSMITRNKYLLEYSNLRLEEFKTYKKSLNNKIYNYNTELENISKKIELVMVKLKEASR